MRLASLTKFPPGGFVYLQPETGWRSSFGSTFQETVVAVAQHRAANPRLKLNTDHQQIAIDIERQICARLASTKGASTWMVSDEGLQSSPPFQEARLQAGHTPAQSSRTVAAIRNAAAGIGAMRDWLGDDLQPVDQELADKRAGTCAACPKNGAGDLIQRLEAWAAEKLRQQISIRGEMQLATPFDTRLKTCLACDCWTPLKVWVPFKHIFAHTRPEIWEQLHPSCWMVEERAKAITPIVVE